MKHNSPALAVLLALCAGCATNASTITPDPAISTPPETGTPDTVATSGDEGGGVIFNVSYRMPANMVCSHDRATGSHLEKEYCRSDAAAREERDTAQEFLRERMRNSH